MTYRTAPERQVWQQPEVLLYVMACDMPIQPAPGNKVLVGCRPSPMASEQLRFAVINGEKKDLFSCVTLLVLAALYVFWQLFRGAHGGVTIDENRYS